MRVRGHDNVWAIGDCAAVPDAATGGAKPTPPTAQHALREGRLVAHNVAAQLGRGTVRPFTYKTKGVFVDLGRYQAVANLSGLKLSGRPAWFAARTYHLVMMPGTSRKLRLMADWTVGLIFGRDSSELGQLGHPPSLRAFVEEHSDAHQTADDL
jgi:NADH dehydrogenase